MFRLCNTLRLFKFAYRDDSALLKHRIPEKEFSITSFVFLISSIAQHASPKLMYLTTFSKGLAYAQLGANSRNTEMAV